MSAESNQDAMQAIEDAARTAADRADVDQYVLRRRNPFLALSMLGALAMSGGGPSRPAIPETSRCTMAESQDKIAAAEEKRRRRAFKRANRGKPR